MSNSFEYIRKYYNIPARKGMWVQLKENPHIRGKIINTKGAYLKVILEGDTKPGYYHPLDLIYPNEK